MCGARFSVDLDLIPRRNNIDAKQPSGGIGPVVPMSLRVRGLVPRDGLRFFVDVVITIYINSMA